MEQSINTIKPRPCADTEYRLRQNLRRNYRRGVIMTDAMQYLVTSLVLVALSALVLTTCFSFPRMASSDWSQGGHMMQLFEKTIPIS